MNEGCITDGLVALWRGSQEDNLCRLGGFREHRAKSPETRWVRETQYVIQNDRSTNRAISPIRIYQNSAGQCGDD